MKKQELKDKYKEVSTPEELLSFMNNNIRFGLYGSNHQIYDASDLDAFSLANEIYFNLSSPLNTLSYGVGECFDQVELERDWFTKNGYTCKTLYITFKVGYPSSYPSHAYLLFKRDDNWYWFENYDKSNFGIHEFPSLEEAITNQMIKHIDIAKQFNPIDQDVLDNIHIYEYETPKYGLKKKELIKHILSSFEVPIVE